MPALLRGAGLTLVASQPHVYAEIGQGRYFRSLVDAYAPLVVRAQVLPRERVERWVAEQHAAQRDETFFAACNYYAYLARREPAAPPSP